ncbi:MAG TPA: discoidin domain-containing protein, partial [Acidimicrobiales bacterium]|nr:discoidin domain-containing protein [Acidimicrobiales bacterium]
PQVLWQEMTASDTDLGKPTTFGAPNPAPTIRYPLNSELRLGIPTGTPQPPALAVFNVSSPRALVRAEPAQPLIVAGDGSGLVEAAADGLLSGNQPIVYSASYADDQGGLRSAAASGATLVVSDTNPLASSRWGSLRDNVGQVDQPEVQPLSSNPSDYSLPVFPGAGEATRTVAEPSGIKDVSASSYGDPLAFTPENKPLNAIDGDPSTAWSYGAYSPVAGGRIQVDLLHPVTEDHVTLLQAQLEQPNRRITRVTLRFDGGSPITVNLHPDSYTSPGQTVSFGTRTFERPDVTVDAATGNPGKQFDGLSPVGFAEIDIPGTAPATETLRMPTDLLSTLGSSSAADPLYLLMNRERQVEVPRHDPEPQMSRTFSLPTGRTFTLGGTAEINSGDSDDLINRLIGLTPPAPQPPATGGEATVVAANSSTRLDGDRAARANSAQDGNASTAWIAETGPQAGEWLGYLLSKPITFDHLDLQLMNDGRHSLPSRITISTENASETVDLHLPPVAYGRPQNSISRVPVLFPALSGANVKVTVDSVVQVRSLDYYAGLSGKTDILPVGIAELGLPGVTQPAAPAALPTVCQPGLLSVDGKPVDVAVTGSTKDAIAGQQLRLRPCGNSVNGIALSAGTHTLSTSSRLPSGWSVDSLALASEPVGTARANPPAGASVVVRKHDRTSWDLTLRSDGKPFWLVLGQSFSSGWSASSNGHSLGAPRLVDGYATGWLVPAGTVHGVASVHIEWKPQRVVWAAITASGLALLVCLVLVAWPPRRELQSGSERKRRVPASSSGSLRGRPGWIGGRARPPIWSVAAWSIFWGLLVSDVSRPAIGAVAAVAVGVGALVPRGRLAVRAVAAAAMLAVPVYVVQQQAAHHYPPTIDWPAAISSANDIAWFALAMVGADAVAGAARAYTLRRVAPNTLDGRGRPQT